MEANNNERVGFWSVVADIFITAIIVAALVFLINLVYAGLIWAWANAHILVGRLVWRLKVAIRNWSRN